MNTIVNDEGNTVIAVGAPGSLVRVQAEFPMAISAIRQMFDNPGQIVSLDAVLRDVRDIVINCAPDYLTQDSIMIAAGMSTARRELVLHQS